MANILLPGTSAGLSALTDNLHLHQPSIYDTINSYRNISTLYDLESTAAAAAQADMNLYNSNDSENSDAPEKDVSSNIYNDDKNE